MGDRTRRTLRRSSALLVALLATAGLLMAAGISPLGATPGGGNGNTCGGPDTGAPGEGGNHQPCDPPPTTQPPTTQPPPPPPPDDPPPPDAPPPDAPPPDAPPADTPVVPPPDAPPVEVGTQIAIREISNVLRRAFVAGESVNLTGTAPASCIAPTLKLDGNDLGSFALESDGTFDVNVLTRDLPSGRHVAEIFCSSPDVRLMRTEFWVAAAQSSSTLFFVILGSAFIIYAIGWAALRSLAGPTLAKSATPVGRPGS